MLSCLICSNLMKNTQRLSKIAKICLIEECRMVNVFIQSVLIGQILHMNL